MDDIKMRINSEGNQLNSLRSALQSTIMSKPMNCILQFPHKQIEKNFKTSLTMNSNISGIEVKDRKKGLDYTLLSLFILQVLLDMYEVSAEDMPAKITIIRALVSLLVLVLSLILVKLVYTRVIISGNFVLLQVVFLLNALQLILLRHSTMSYFLDDSSPELISPLYLFLLLVLPSKFVLFFNFFQFFICTFFALGVFFGVALITEPIKIAIQELLIGSLFLLYNTRVFYIIEKKARINFFVKTRQSIRQSLVSEENFPQTRVEKTMTKIVDSLDIVSRLHKKFPTKSGLLVIAETLHSAMNFLGNNRSVDIDSITQNMNYEDRVYIQESFVSSQDFPNTKNIRSRSKRDETISSLDVSHHSDHLREIGNNWDMDFLALNEKLDFQPLAMTGKFLLQVHSLDSTFQMAPERVTEFFTQLELKYLPKPYHNSTHAADVAASFWYLKNSSDLQMYISDVELLAAIISTLGHDVGHPGLTGRFLIHARDSIAITYNDCSVLEMMHTSIIYRILQTPACNILGKMEEDEWFALRKLIVSMVLATDLTKHFEFMGIFKAKTMQAPTRPLNTIEQRLDVLKIITKAADVGHAAKTWTVHEKWSQLAIEEFFRQGDIEKNRGMKISMYCDRENTDISKSQAGFIRNIALPLFVAMNDYLLSSVIEENCIDNLNKNICCWENAQLNKSRTAFDNSTNLEEKPRTSRVRQTLRASRKPGNGWIN